MVPTLVTQGTAALLLALISVWSLVTGGTACCPAEALVAGRLSEPAAVQLDSERHCSGLCF